MYLVIYVVTHAAAIWGGRKNGNLKGGRAICKRGWLQLLELHKAKLRVQNMARKMHTL